MLTSPLSNASNDELNDEKSSPLTAIVMMPNSTPSGSINEVINQDEDIQPFLRKRRSTRVILMTDVSYRLSRRQALHERL
jgi:hypothetical protein